MSIEAMKQALEFVASISPAFICEATHHSKKERHDVFKPCPHVERHNRVFESLRQAIEQAERQQALDKKAENARELGLDYEPTEIPIEETLRRAYYFDEHGKWRGSDVSEWQRWHGVAKAAKQAEKQEPVAYGVDWGKAGETPCVSIIKRLPDGGVEVLAVEYGPQRQWVGLDDTDLASVSGVEVEWAQHWEKVLKGKNT